jgi:hypothetical protein
LESIKNVCEPFDLARVDFYKQLQKRMADETVAFVELESQDAPLLRKNSFRPQKKLEPELCRAPRLVSNSPAIPDSEEATFPGTRDIAKAERLNP